MISICEAARDWILISLLRVCDSEDVREARTAEETVDKVVNVVLTFPVEICVRNQTL